MNDLKKICGSYALTSRYIFFITSLSFFSICLLGCCDVPLHSHSDAPQIRRLRSNMRAPVSSQPLKILTWNIWMMPSIRIWKINIYTLESPKNEKRAAAVADELLAKDFDILCLEKVFDGEAREVLANKLASRYPFQYGPLNAQCSLTINGGVCIFSKLPLCLNKEIEFRDSAGWERLSRKGAMLLTGTFQNRKFHLIATHLEGEEGPEPTPEHEAVREKQMAQIKADLIDELETNVPIFLCGDFCTPRRDEQNTLRDSASYDYMIKTFGCENGVSDRITLNDNLWRNDLATDDTGRIDEMDYILVKQNGIDLHTTWDTVIMRNNTWDGGNGRQDLSYRYAVSAFISFPHNPNGYGY